jgi:hypothetical protein
MRRIKRVLDARGILNPGKIFPESVPPLVPSGPLPSASATGISAEMDPG